MVKSLVEILTKKDIVSKLGGSRDVDYRIIAQATKTYLEESPATTSMELLSAIQHLNSEGYDVRNLTNPFGNYHSLRPSINFYFERERVKFLHLEEAAKKVLNLGPTAKATITTTSREVISKKFVFYTDEDKLKEFLIPGLTVVLIDYDITYSKK